MVARNNTYAHREKKIPAWVLGGFVLLLRFLLSIISIFSATKTDSGLQLHCLKWVKSQAMEHWVLGALQAHSVTQHFCPIQLLVVTLCSNS